MTEQNKTPEANKNVADVKPNEVKPNDATPIPEKGNVAPIDSAAPKVVEAEKPAETDKERKQA